MSKKIVEIEFESETISLYIWSNGDGYEADGKDFESGAEVVDYLKQFGEVKHASVYEPDKDGETIITALKYSGPIGTREDGPGLYK